MTRQIVITVRTLAPTATRGTRVKARCVHGSKTIPYPYEGDWPTACRMAADALLREYGLHRHYTELLAEGDLPSGSDTVLILRTPYRY